MKLERYKTAVEFLNRTQRILEEDELANNLVLGIALRLKDGYSYGVDAPYLAVVEDGGVPVLMAVMTPPHRLLLTGNDEKRNETISLLAADLVSTYPKTSGVLARRAFSERFAEQWARMTGVDARIWMNQRLYRLTEVKPTREAKGTMRSAEKDDMEFLLDWAYAMNVEIKEKASREMVCKSVESHINNRSLYLWTNEVPVSMAASARPLRNGITINLVYTPPKYRRHGYATACVSSLCKKLLENGYRYCSLYADLVNRTSNSIYLKIGFEPVYDFVEYNFITHLKTSHLQTT